MTTEDFDGEAFRKECELIRDTKRQAFLDALVQLETAAWSRHWTALEVARNEIERLTGLTIVGPLRRDLEEAASRGV